MSYSACDFAEEIACSVSNHGLPEISRETWNKMTDQEYGADDWPPEDGEGLIVLAHRVHDAFTDRRDLLALLRDIREFWTGGDCPPELWARIEAATGAAP